MYLLCGIGNPGKKYQDTRHNIGFKIIDKINLNYNFKVFKKDKDKEIYKGKVQNLSCFIIKPLNFMNLSGIEIKKFCNFYKINNNKIIVTHDDLDLLLGKVKYKKGGSNGGHLGLKSIDENIGKEYNRLRIGIGHPGNKDLVSKYVLQKFTKEEKKVLKLLSSSISNNLIYLLKNRKDIFLNNISIDLT